MTSLCQITMALIFNTFHTAERGPRSSISTFIVLENTAKLKPYQNELPSNEGRELFHFLLHCFDIQIGEKYNG